MKIEISKCAQGDVESVGKLYDKVVKHLTETVNYPRWIYKVYPSELSAREMTERGEQYKAEVDGTLAAAFVLNDDPQGAYERCEWGAELSKGEYLVIHALAVDEDLSRRGIGKRIVEFCIGQAKERGYKAVRLDVVPKNLPAERLYEGCGFVRRGEYDLDRPFDIPSFVVYEYII